MSRRPPRRSQNKDTPSRRLCQRRVVLAGGERSVTGSAIETRRCFAFVLTRQLGLKHVAGTALSVPLDQVLQTMFSCKSEHGHVITVHHQRVVTRIVAVLDEAARDGLLGVLYVVRAPKPHVVPDHRPVGSIDLHHAVDRGLRTRRQPRPAHPRVHVMDE